MARSGLEQPHRGDEVLVEDHLACGGHDEQFPARRRVGAPAPKWVAALGILDDIAEVMWLHGPGLTAYRYNCIRTQIRRESGRALVTAQTATTRFGSWDQAKAEAAIEHPDLPYDN